jgi:hypothetical protein
MEEATIRFEGDAFHWAKWAELLRRMGFRLVGGCPERAVYACGGSSIVAESRGFVRRNDQQGHEWQVALKLTRRWEGTIKFYAVLLAAYTIPEGAVVTLSGQEFLSRDALRSHAEAAITQDYAPEELIDHGVYRMGDGVQFV